MKTKFTRLLILFLLLAFAGNSFAEGIGPGFTIPSAGGFKMAPGTRVFYVYAKSGEKIYWELNKLSKNTGAAGTDHKVTLQVFSPKNTYSLPAPPSPNSTNYETFIAKTAATGTITNFGAGLSSTYTIIVGSRDGEAGIWTFVISQGFTQDAFSNGDNSRFSFNVSVKAGNSASAEIPGRVYVENLRISQGTASTFPLFSVDQFGYQYKTTLNNLRPIDIEFVIDNVGNTLKGTNTSAYKSFSFKNNDALTYDNPSINSIYDNTITNVPDKAKIFLNQPDATIPSSADIWSRVTNATTTEWLIQATPLPATVSGLTFTPDAVGVPGAGNFSFSIANYKGKGTLYIDANNDGDFADAVDKTIPLSVTSGTNTINFDGKDGSGNLLTCRQAFKAKVDLDKIAEIHFVLWDAEGLDGIKIERLNGTNPGSTISWDDTPIQAAGGKTTTTSAVTGNKLTSATATGIHGWAFDTDNPPANDPWGNNNYIDNWAFLPDIVTVTATLAAGTSSDFGDLLATKWPVASARVATCSFSANKPTAFNGTTMNDVVVFGGNQVDAETSTKSGGSEGAGTDNFDDGLKLPAQFKPNANASFTVSVNANKANTVVNFALWFDWDGNGTFDAAFPGSGTVVTALTAVAVVKQVAIPSTATGNFKVRLIVSSTAVPALTNTTLSIASGEIEDYVAPPVNTTLPVTLSSFSAVRKDNSALLSWATETEISNAGFTVQRSNNQQQWETIGYLTSKAINGNSSSTLNYTFTDNMPLAGANFYRLLQTDIDSKTSYSDIRLVTFGKTSILVYPTNPTDGKVNIRGLGNGAVINVFSNNGALLSVNKTAGAAAEIDISKYNKGLYLIRITNEDGSSSTYKIVY